MSNATQRPIVPLDALLACLGDDAAQIRGLGPCEGEGTPNPIAPEWADTMDDAANLLRVLHGCGTALLLVLEQAVIDEKLRHEDEFPIVLAGKVVHRTTIGEIIARANMALGYPSEATDGDAEGDAA
jgi:hypothetical protein